MYTTTPKLLHCDVDASRVGATIHYLAKFSDGVHSFIPAADAKRDFVNGVIDYLEAILLAHPPDPITRGICFFTRVKNEIINNFNFFMVRNSYSEP